MPHNDSLQDAFLNTLCKQEAPVSIFLVNGIKLHGIVDCFDSHVVMLKSTVTQMVFKHSISTIVPSKSIVINTKD